MKIKLYQDDIPSSLKLGKSIVAIDTEAMGLNHQRDRFVLFKYQMVMEFVI